MILISERIISIHQKDIVLINAAHRKKTETNSSILDDPGQFNFDLRIPLYLKGNPFNMLLPSKIEILESRLVLELKIYCNLNKPIFVSLLLGTLGLVFFQWLHGQLIFSMLVALFISLLQFGLMYYAIKKRTQEYLRELTRSSSNE